MFEQYSHLLISDRPDFAPSPAAVAGTFESLIKAGGVPREASFKLGTLSGCIRRGRDSLTGDAIELPIWDYQQVGSMSELPNLLAGLNDYNCVMEGKRPAILPPFTLYNAANGKRFTGDYGYSICVHLRGKQVRFGESDGSVEGRASGFRHPETGALIEGANAVSARFWIALEFGRWVLPEIRDSLEILDPSLIAIFGESIGVRLVQGCSTC